MDRLIGMEDLATTKRISVSHAGKIQMEERKELDWIVFRYGPQLSVFSGPIREHLPFSPDCVS